MFIDEASITVKGGDGGNGCLSFRREKYVPRGGPNGGDGGSGGSVFLVASADVSTLLAFRYRHRFEAPRGRHGEGSNRTGRTGEDLVIRVPQGTVVLDEDGIRVLADLAEPDQRYVAATGGQGGRGNARFATSTNRAPTRHEPGRPGERCKLRLELKLLADVGLVGFPNAGKSTLVSRISAARPRIADYPFTTLEPCLGVVDRGDYRSFVVADIPGLIEGAHEGAGLGDRFLRHIERCRLLLHLVDTTDPERDPVKGISAIDHELLSHPAELEDKPQIIVLTKADAVQDEDRVRRVRRLAAERGLSCHLISSATGMGLKELIHDTSAMLDRLGARPRDVPGEPRLTTPAVGVLGGTFDPVHVGHLAMAQYVRDRLALSRVLILPTATPPHKPPHGLSPIADRVEMVRLALAGRGGLELCEREARPGRVCYTVDTLRALRDEAPPCRPVFIMGMDSLRQIETWRDAPGLLREFDVAVIDRPGHAAPHAALEVAPEIAKRVVLLGQDGPTADELDPGRGGRIFHLALPPIPVSSSDIRARAATGDDLDGLVPPAVAEYIHRSGLYRQEKRR